MKLLLVFFICFLGRSIEVSVDPYSETGHEQFTKLEYNHPDKLLLVEMTDFFIEINLRELKSKFWGSRNEYYCLYEDATYIGEIIFSRSNKTRDPYEFDYSLTEVEYYERSINIEGSVSVEGKVKKDKVEKKGKIEIEAGINVEESKKTTESSDMSVTVYPNKKVTLRVAGEAKISSGFSKNYICWICIKKGAWETVDITTSYFELVEEDA